MLPAGALIWHGRDLRRYKRLLSPPLQRLLTCPGTAALGRGLASMPASYAHEVCKKWKKRKQQRPIDSSLKCACTDSLHEQLEMEMQLHPLADAEVSMPALYLTRGTAQVMYGGTSFVHYSRFVHGLISTCSRASSCSSWQTVRLVPALHAHVVCHSINTLTYTPVRLLTVAC